VRSTYDKHIAYLPLCRRSDVFCQFNRKMSGEHKLIEIRYKT